MESLSQPSRGVLPTDPRPPGPPMSEEVVGVERFLRTDGM